MLITKELLDNVTEQAKNSPRLRMNYNLHESLDAKAQRLFNALEPGTVLPIHRHPHTDETYILLRGSFVYKFYNDNGDLVENGIIDSKKEVYGIHVPKNQWHTIDVLESGTVIFEVKDGPYTPFAPEDVLNLNK